MADKKTPPTIENAGEMLEEATESDLDYGSVLSGMRGVLEKEFDPLSGSAAVSKNREDLKKAEASSFDPKIMGPWRDNSPEAQAQREETKEAGKAYRGKFAEMLAKRRAAKKAALEESKEKKKEAKEKAYESANERMETAVEAANESKRLRLQDKVNKYQEKATQAYDKGDNFAFQWYVNQIPKLKEQLVTEKYKKVPTKADILDLDKDERKSIMNAEKDVLKSQFKAIDDLTKSDEYKGDKRELKALKKAYQKGIAETTKRDAPYAIRNAFLIIDAIQKSLQNIGRALPKGSLNPAYTQTPMEEPELFKLWREQIEKGQERTQKAEDAGTNVFENIIKNTYGVPEGTMSKAMEREWKWDDKIREAKLEGVKPEVMMAYKRKMEQDFGDTMTQADIERAARIAAYEEAGKGNLVQAEKKLWLANNYNNIYNIAAKLSKGAIANKAFYSILDEIAKSGALKVATMGIANDAINALTAALKAFPDFTGMTTEQVLDEIYKLGGGKADMASFLANVHNINRTSLNNIEKQMTSVSSEMDKIQGKITGLQTQKDLNAIAIEHWEAEKQANPRNAATYNRYIDDIKYHNGAGEDYKPKYGNVPNNMLERQGAVQQKALDEYQKRMDGLGLQLQELLMPGSTKEETADET